MQALLDWCTEAGIHMTAYSPLGSPDSAAQFKRSEDVPRVLEDPVVNEIAAKLGKNVGQVRRGWVGEGGPFHHTRHCDTWNACVTRGMYA